jgi:hypothetical protein
LPPLPPPPLPPPPLPFDDFLLGGQRALRAGKHRDQSASFSHAAKAWAKGGAAPSVPGVGAEGEQAVRKYPSGFPDGGGGGGGGGIAGPLAPMGAKAPQVFGGDAFSALRAAYSSCAHEACPVAGWMPDGAQEDSFVGRKALQLLRRRPRDKPFFLQVQGAACAVGAEKGKGKGGGHNAPRRAHVHWWRAQSS